MGWRWPAAATDAAPRLKQPTDSALRDLDTLGAVAPRLGPVGLRFPGMRLYGLVEAGDPEAADVYLCEEDAQRAL
jgi:hypothetical protein